MNKDIKCKRTAKSSLSKNFPGRKGCKIRLQFVKALTGSSGPGWITQKHPSTLGYPGLSQRYQVVHARAVQWALLRNQDKLKLELSHTWYHIPMLCYLMMARSDTTYFVAVFMKVTPKVCSRCCCGKYFCVVHCLNILFISHRPFHVLDTHKSGCLLTQSPFWKAEGYPEIMESSIHVVCFHRNSEIQKLISSGFQS